MESMNWGDLVKSAEVERIPAGEYDVIVSKAEAKTFSSGNEGISTLLLVENGPHMGEKIPNNFMFMPDHKMVMRMFFVGMTALGLTTEYFKTNNPSLEAVANELVGRRARAKIAHRDSNDFQGYDVKSLKSPTDGNQKTVGSAPNVPTNAAPSGTMSPKPSIPTSPAPMTPSTPSSMPPVPPSI